MKLINSPWSKQVLKVILVVLGLWPWIVYALNINVGLDSLIDEGQMLLLSNRPKPLGHLGSQSGVLIGLITDHFAYTATTLLWTRYLLQCLSTAFLLVSSFIFLKRRVNSKLDAVSYAGIFLLVSSICLYLFTKTVSYNHVQQFLILSSLSLYLLNRTYDTIHSIRLICLISIGVLSTFAILNIAPSGALCSALLLFTLLVESPYPGSKPFITLGLFVLGVILGFGIFHVLVKDLWVLYKEIGTMYHMVGKLNRSYDSFSIFYNAAKSLLSLFVVGITSLGLLSVYELLKSKLRSERVALAIVTLLFIGAVIYSVKFTQTGAIYEWIAMPLFLSLFITYRDGLPATTRNQRWTLLLLIAVPVFASMGTNLMLTYKIGYFFGTWLIATLIVVRNKNQIFRRIVVVILICISMTWNVQAYQGLLLKKQEARVQTMTLDRLSQIYITPKQKAYFEGVFSHLQNNNFSQGDTIIAFQPDLMTVFAVGGTAGRRVYFVPSDFLNDDLSSIHTPKFLILNDYSYSQISPALQELWGFPERYRKIDIGSPETVDYFSAHKSRMLFCLKLPYLAGNQANLSPSQPCAEPVLNREVSQ